MLYSAVTFLFGATITQYWHQVPTQRLMLGIAVCAVLSLVIAYYLRKRWLAYIASIALGWVWLFFAASSVLTPSLPASWIGKTVIVQGRLVSQPIISGQRQKFMFAIEQARLSQHEKKRMLAQRVLLNWYRVPKNVTLRYGSHWQLSVRLKPGWGHNNPGGFDYEKWLLTQKISYVGYVLNAETNQQKKSPNLFTYISRWRTRLQMRVQAALGNDQASHLLLAMLIGKRTQLSPATWRLLQATGTSHLMAISGLHIGMIAAIVAFLVLRLWRLNARLCLLMPAPFAASLSALLAAASYSALSGFALPTQRALLMLSLIVIAILCKRRFIALHAFSFALWCILILEPLSVLTIGFWLSFAAVASILYGMGYRQKSGLFFRLLRTQWVVTLLLGPLTLWFFGQVSLVGLLANAVAIPWIGFVVLPLGFLGLILLFIFPTFGEMCLHFSTLLLHTLWQYLSWLSHWPGAQWIYPLTHISVLLSIMIGVSILLAPRGWPMRWLGFFWLLPLFYFPLPNAPAYGEFSFTLLDVGQGLASVVRTKHHVLLYDTGPRYSETNDAGLSVVLPYLRANRLKSISRIIVSHGDADHSGGLASIVRTLPVDDVLTSEPDRLPIPSRRCEKGQRWQYDGVQFEMLSPPGSRDPTIKSWRNNDKSCVLKVTNKFASVLLTGDVERKTEAYLTRTIPNKLKSDVLIVPHHGSLTSSTPAFIAAVAPKIVLFSVGYRNRFGFPKGAVLARYQVNESKFYLSWRCGALSLALNGNPKQWIPQCQRQIAHFYWQPRLIF